MSLNIIDDTEKVELGPSKDGTYNGAMGGTEMMNKMLYERVDNDLLDEFYFIKSRVRWTDTHKQNILWLHDLVSDPEAAHLSDPESRKRFAKLVFVSNWQLSTYSLGLGVPYSESVVIRNAIDPIELSANDKTDDTIRIIYHTTPHRGLNIAVAAVKEIAKTVPNIHFDVFSSFEAYGWKERDEPYKDLFKEIEEHPNMTYHGYQPNNVVREALKHAHIFAYPSLWQETSCIAAIEAMSAGCEVVCSNLAALPETTGGFARMYQFDEDVNHHANVFVNNLYHAIQHRLTDNIKSKLQFQKNWVDGFYNWDLRSAEWTQFLQSLKK